MENSPDSNQHDNYLLLKCNHIFEKSFSMRNQASLDYDSLAKDIENISYNQKNKLKDVLKQFGTQRTNFALSIVNKNLKNSNLLSKLEDSFEFHTLATLIPEIETHKFFTSLDDDLSELFLAKILKEKNLRISEEHTIEEEEK